MRRQHRQAFNFGKVSSFIQSISYIYLSDGL